MSLWFYEKEKWTVPFVELFLVSLLPWKENHSEFIQSLRCTLQQNKSYHLMWLKPRFPAENIGSFPLTVCPTISGQELMLALSWLAPWGEGLLNDPRSRGEELLNDPRRRGEGVLGVGDWSLLSLGEILELSEPSVSPENVCETRLLWVFRPEFVWTVCDPHWMILSSIHHHCVWAIHFNGVSNKNVNKSTKLSMTFDCFLLKRQDFCDLLASHPSEVRVWKLFNVTVKWKATYSLKKSPKR